MIVIHIEIQDIYYFKIKNERWCSSGKLATCSLGVRDFKLYKCVVKEEEE